MRVLVTGGAGFIGHHVVSYILETTDWDVVVLDRLDTSGNLNRLVDIPQWETHKKRVSFVFHDLKAPLNEGVVNRIGAVEYILHLAASTHVDRSITDPMLFAMDNVIGTVTILDFARSHAPLKRFINFSTDEVFGPASVGYAHTEDDPYKPSNPYSAGKAGAASFGHSYFVTYGTPIVTAYTMNNFGERQHPEKLVPKTIRSVVRGERVPIFASLDASGKLMAVGSRYWLHARNTASAIMFMLNHGVVGEGYNVVGFDELTNLEMAERIAAVLGKPLLYDLVDFHAMRPGHDMRYALDGAKLRALGWKPEVDFDESLKRTVKFCVDHPEWV